MNVQMKHKARVASVSGNTILSIGTNFQNPALDINPEFNHQNSLYSHFFY